MDHTNTIIIIGANSGLGFECARNIASSSSVTVNAFNSGRMTDTSFAEENALELWNRSAAYTKLKQDETLPDLLLDF